MKNAKQYLDESISSIGRWVFTYVVAPALVSKILSAVTGQNKNELSMAQHIKNAKERNRAKLEVYEKIIKDSTNYCNKTKDPKKCKEILHNKLRQYKYRIKKLKEFT